VVPAYPGCSLNGTSTTTTQSELCEYPSYISWYYHTSHDTVLCCAYYTGESSFHVKPEADSSDTNEHSQHDNLCPYSSTTNSCLKVHGKQQTGGNWYSCLQCQKRFSSQNTLRRHMNIHRCKYRCTECGKCFERKEHLVRHGRSHSGEKPFECIVCGRRFTQLSDLVRHNRIHGSEKPYICYMCDRAFRRLENLQVHIRVHTGEKPYKCLLCSKSFCQSGDLQKHICRMHSSTAVELKKDDTVAFECTVCRKRFKTSSDLVRHTRVHSGEKPYKCHVCDKSFSQSGSLKAHMRIHTGEKPYKCSLCNNSFKTSSELNKHKHNLHSNMGNEMNEAENVRFECTICSKLFKTSHGLVIHSSTHVENSSFSRSSNLLRHRRHAHITTSNKLKQDVNKVECTNCGK